MNFLEFIHTYSRKFDIYLSRLAKNGVSLLVDDLFPRHIFIFLYVSLNLVLIPLSPFHSDVNPPLTCGFSA